MCVVRGDLRCPFGGKRLRFTLNIVKAIVSCALTILMNAASLGYPLFTLRPKYIAHWAPPFDGELLDQEKRKLIIENLAGALDFMGITSDTRDEQANVIGNFDSQGWVWKDEQWLNK